MILMTGVSHMDSYVQFITVLIIFLFVLVVTWFVTRWISKFQKEQITGTNIEIIETQRISSTKYLQIIRAGEKYLVIAVCKDTVTMLAEIPGESIIPNSMNGAEKLDFGEILEKVKTAAKTKKDHGDEEK